MKWKRCLDGKNLAIVWRKYNCSSSFFRLPLWPFCKLLKNSNKKIPWIPSPTYEIRFLQTPQASASVSEFRKSDIFVCIHMDHHSAAHAVHYSPKAKEVPQPIADTNCYITCQHGLQTQMIENPRLVKMWEVMHIVKHMTFAQFNNLPCSFFCWL